MIINYLIVINNVNSLIYFYFKIFTTSYNKIKNLLNIFFCINLRDLIKNYKFSLYYIKNFKVIELFMLINNND